jgi:hypothetical protein
MEVKPFTRLLHFKQQAGLPDKISKTGRFSFLDSIFEGSPSLLVALVPERLKQSVAENLCLALFITVQRLGVIDKTGEVFKDLGHAVQSHLRWGAPGRQFEAMDNDFTLAGQGSAKFSVLATLYDGRGCLPTPLDA